ncbi:LRR domain containing protein [Parasponia andersonii]|uniref:LRR domain containing protein n=1 Tax=Parasponia andersonii TaxID=3476 RepID=A0A2P5D2M1_PARAD|nr:LRR domain containing protein [Parasponia andersonii]
MAAKGEIPIVIDVQSRRKKIVLRIIHSGNQEGAHTLDHSTGSRELMGKLNGCEALSGLIPLSIGNLTVPKSLDLSKNKLLGEILSSWQTSNFFNS